MTTLAPVAAWRKYLITVGAVLLWLAFVAACLDGSAFTASWWLVLVAAVAVSVAAADLLRHPTAR